MQISFTDDDDVTLAAAYARIGGLHLRYDRDDTGALVPLSTIDVAIFASATTAGNAQKRPKVWKSYPVPTAATRLIFALQATPTAVIPLVRAYLFLKTLDEFAGAVDV